MTRGRGFACLFIILTATAIFFSRHLFIEKTPGWADFPDIRIYQVVGKAVLAGVNPYDYSDHVETRRQLRLGMALSPTDFVTVSEDTWNHYLSDNLPGSTVLYALLEKIANGSRRAWRELFIAGDIAILLGLWALMETLKGGILDARRQAAVICLTVFYPILSMSIPFVSEDKQIQTALLLFGAALLLNPDRRSALKDLLVGFVLSFGVIFKLFGIILFPLWLSKARERPISFTIWSIAGGCVPLLLAYWMFGAGPVTAILQRGARASAGLASSGSPWRLLPVTSPMMFVAARLITNLLCVCGLVFLFLKGKIDALNLSAGLGVVLGCLWLQNGSMDRMNIVIMFAIACLATLSTARFLGMALFVTALSAVGFELKQASGGVDQRLDAIIVALFVLAYAVTLSSLRRAPTAGRPGQSQTLADISAPA